MTDHEKVMSWLEGLTDEDWRRYHSDSEVRTIAKAALELLKEQPEIIRCEDCKWNAGTKEKPYCQIFSMGRRKDWFCADGERKED